MGLFDGKVAVITGAGRGIGRESALLLAREGAAVVVNDLGCETDGSGSDETPARDVVAEIEAAGGAAVPNFSDVSNFQAAEQLIGQAVETFGGLDILINIAGFLRDRMSFNMTEEDWDASIAGVLKGHFCPTRHAMAYWRAKNKETGESVNAKVVSTASESGLYGNVAQLNYNAGKAGIASMAITLAREGERIGVRSNAITPTAGTRLLAGIGSGADLAEGEWNPMAPENVAPAVGWLASDLSAGVNGQVVKIGGGKIQLLRGWRPVTEVLGDKTWSIEDIESMRDTLFAKTPDHGVFQFMPPVEA
jgi:NAD(P)-dependent dehydrogenase (short-subunit alcohol dehydrogenase family)